MGLSVWSEVDTKQYFSISTIKRDQMNEHGLTCTIKELQEMARKSVPVAEIYTGQRKNTGMRKKTKIYKYDDFRNRESTGIKTDDQVIAGQLSIFSS